MAEQKVIHLPTRRLVVELDIRVPNSNHSPRGKGREAFDRAVADAVKRELARTRRN